MKKNQLLGLMLLSLSALFTQSAQAFLGFHSDGYYWNGPLDLSDEEYYRRYGHYRNELDRERTENDRLNEENRRLQQQQAQSQNTRK